MTLFRMFTEPQMRRSLYSPNIINSSPVRTVQYGSITNTNTYVYLLYFSIAAKPITIQ